MRSLALTLAAAVLLPLAANAADPPKPDSKPDPKADPPKAKTADKAETKYEIPYRLTDTKHVHVRVKLNGKGPFNFILDTGAPAVFVTKAVAKKAGLDVDDKGWGEFKSFDVEGGLAVDKVRCRVEDLFQLEGMNGLGLAGVELHGVIGYNTLSRFRITYDFTADKLTWVPLTDFAPPEIKSVGKGGGQGGLEIMGPMMKMLAGFMGVKPNFEVKAAGSLGLELEEKKEGVFVKAVLKDGPADKGGLKVGDKLVAVGGSSVDDLRDLRRAILKAAAGDKVKVKFNRNEEEQTVTVELGKGL